MVYLILLGALFFMQLLAASWYDLAKKATDTKKAFKHKMICSGISLACALLCVAIKGSYLDAYSVLFIGSAFLLFLHDASEEKPSKPISIISSMLCCGAYTFLAGALILKKSTLFTSTLFSTKVLYIALGIAFFVCIITQLKSHKVPYLISSAYMLAIAFMIGIPLQNSGVAKMQTASCAIIMGALAIAVSSALSAFDKKDKKSLLRINLYYFGFMFISCSVAVL